MLEDGDASIPPSECVATQDEKCVYSASLDLCKCTRYTMGLDYVPVKNCTERPAGVLVLQCPDGWKKPAQPWACDGECHAETCTGGAGEQCDMFGCTNMQWTCSSNQCIKIPSY